MNFNQHTLKVTALLCCLTAAFTATVKAQGTQYQYLSGTDKDHTVAWDFLINTGTKSGVWSQIQVQSYWEQQAHRQRISGRVPHSVLTNSNNL